MRNPARWRVVGVTVLCSLALSASSTSALDDEIDDLGPVPQTCEAAGKDFTDPSCTTQTRNGTFSVSPHVVHAGGTFTGTISQGCKYDNGDGTFKPCPTDWPQFQATPSLSFNSGIKPTTRCSDKDYTCTWKVAKTAATQKYTIIEVGITSGQGRGISKDYFAIIGQGYFELAGHVKDEDKKPIAGVTISIVGPKNLTLKTDATGQYSAVLKKGKYSVSASAKKGGAVFAPAPSKDCEQSGAVCSVNLIQDRSADFVADSSVHVDLAFSPESLPADGTSFGSMSITATNAIGDPVTDQTLHVSPPLGDPPFLICTPSGRAYPNVFPSSGDVVGLSFDKKTDDAGKIEGTVVAGTDVGEATTSAETPEHKHATEVANKTVTLTGQAGGPVPDLLADQIRAAVASDRGTTGGYLAFSRPLSLLDPNAAQSLILDALARYARDGAVPLLQSVAFAPIHSQSGGVGVLFYPLGTPRGSILKLGVNARVLDIGTLLQSSSGATTFPDHYPTLSDWQQTGIPVHGQALPGHPTHVAGEELAYFGLPYPPPEGSVNSGGHLGRNTYDEQCSQPDRNLVAVTVHSPVAVTLDGPNGKKLGTDAKGKAVTTGPGLVERNGDVTTIVAPAGNYKVSLTGTGKGPATLVFWNADGKPQVVALRARKRVKGSATFTAAGPGKVKYGGHRVAVTRGLALRARGLKHTYHGGRRAIRIVVRDQFAKAVPGALVTISGAAHTAAQTTAKGVARLRVNLPKRRGKLTATIRAAGFRAVKLHARVRK